ncbi:cholesterol 7-desaturase nvd [Cololabis saira]|uniref:cholesterol 7-desaturase nvd n=1 Tax=Cololabis saira TaxID=129043 RepID=UPI002AD36CCF|nr:cholesterol 7-desaturase nvd [Cololabis saira]
MLREKAAALFALIGAGALLVAQSGAPQDAADTSWHRINQGPMRLSITTERAVVVIIAALALLVLSWLYRLLFCPLLLLRTPDDMGYVAEDGRTKAQAANQVRRRRKVGELPPIYPNGWYRVLDSHMLKNGDVKNVSVLGEQVAVFRGQDGKAYVLDAYCPHLGANLAVGGQVSGNCLECPFHGWQFRGNDGKCVKIPYAEKVPEFVSVQHWRSCEVNQQILIWFHCDGDKPHWTVPEQQEITNGQWVYRGRTEHFINAHIEEIPENAADIAHLNYLHTPGIASGVDLRYTHSKTWEFMRHNWKVQWEPEPEPNEHCSQMVLKHALTVFGWHWPLLDLHVVARQVGPGLVFLQFNHSFLGQGMIMQSVTPVEPLLQCVSHSIFYQSNTPAVVPKFLLKAECIQFERDVMIWNYKKYNSKPVLTKEDSAIRKHRRWYSQFYSENSPRLQYQRDTLDF